MKTEVDNSESIVIDDVSSSAKLRAKKRKKKGEKNKETDAFIRRNRAWVEQMAVICTEVLFKRAYSRAVKWSKSAAVVKERIGGELSALDVEHTVKRLKHMSLLELQSTRAIEKRQNKIEMEKKQVAKNWDKNLRQN